MKFRGFTLVEVLITLVIIGVVAAMIMPALIADFQKKVTVAKLKKVYTTLYQAYKMSENDNGFSDEWVNTSLEINTDNVKSYVQQYWLPYLNKVDECSKYGDCAYTAVGTQRDGDSISLTGNNRYTVVLSDGTLIAFVPFSWDKEAKLQYWGNSQRFYIDLNGAKRPNIVGKDIFILQLNSEKHSLRGAGYTSLNNIINSDCSFTGSGHYCAEKIIRDGWKIKDDYPW